MYSAVYWKALATVGCERILKLPPDIRHRFGQHVRALVVGITYLPILLHILLPMVRDGVGGVNYM